MFKDLRLMGLGQLLRGDDALGILALRQIVAQCDLSDLGLFSVFEHNGEAASLIYHLQGAKKVLILDAIQTGETPGTLVTFDASIQSLPHSWLASTHSFGLAEALELSRALNELPGEVVVMGITPEELAIGTPLSENVKSMMPELVKKATETIKKWSQNHA